MTDPPPSAQSVPIDFTLFWIEQASDSTSTSASTHPSSPPLSSAEFQCLISQRFPRLSIRPVTSVAKLYPALSILAHVGRVQHDRSHLSSSPPVLPHSAELESYFSYFGDEMCISEKKVSAIRIILYAPAQTEAQALYDFLHANSLNVPVMIISDNKSLYLDKKWVHSTNVETILHFGSFCCILWIDPHESSSEIKRFLVKFRKLGIEISRRSYAFQGIDFLKNNLHLRGNPNFRIITNRFQNYPPQYLQMLQAQGSEEPPSSSTDPAYHATLLLNSLRQLNFRDHSFFIYCGQPDLIPEKVRSQPNVFVSKSAKECYAFGAFENLLISSEALIPEQVPPGVEYNVRIWSQNGPPFPSFEIQVKPEWSFAILKRRVLDIMKKRVIDCRLTALEDMNGQPIDPHQKLNQLGTEFYATYSFQNEESSLHPASSSPPSHVHHHPPPPAAEESDRADDRGLTDVDLLNESFRTTEHRQITQALIKQVIQDQLARDQLLQLLQGSALFGDQLMTLAISLKDIDPQIFAQQALKVLKTFQTSRSPSRSPHRSPRTHSPISSTSPDHSPTGTTPKSDRSPKKNLPR